MNYRNTNLILAFIAVFILTGAAFGQVTPPSEMIAWYAGDGDFRDSSGNGFNATPAAGALSPTFLVGKVGQGFNLNGMQYATIPDSPTLRPQSLTIEGWGKLTAGGAKVFFSKTLGSATSDSYAVFYSSGLLRGTVCNNTGCIEISSAFSLNVWHHIAFSYDDPGGVATKTARLYVDGVLAATNTTGGAIGYDTRPVVIGADIENGMFLYQWIGGIDDVALYNRALSLTEIQSINNAGINGKTKQSTTNTGANSQTVINDATITFANVTTAGTTTDYTIDPTTVGTLPMDFTQTGLAYDISTTAVYSGTVNECFHIPSINDETVFSKLKVLHLEGGTLVDRTSSYLFSTRIVCGRTTSLSPFVIANGLVPTAANVAVGGRVLVGKNGLAKARVTLTDFNGETRSVMTSSFGYYRFDDLEAGSTYIVSVNHKRYFFVPQVISASEDLTEVNFRIEE